MKMAVEKIVQKEIAKMVGLNSAAVRMRCGRAMKRLKKLLEADGITL